MVLLPSVVEPWRLLVLLVDNGHAMKNLIQVLRCYMVRQVLDLVAYLDVSHVLVKLHRQLNEQC